MKLEVIDRDGVCKASTEYEECVNLDLLKYQADDGFKFKLDGKVVSYATLASRFGNRVKQIVIQCVETGDEFKTQSEAARKYNIDPAQVSDSIKTGRPRSGYTFIKVEV